MSIAVLFVSHLINKRYLERYLKLRDDLKDRYNVYWLFQADTGVSGELLYNHGVNVVEFTLDELNDLNYSPIGEHLIPGNAHFIMEYFYHLHSEYQNYWFVEYDVVFTGKWSDLMDAFADNDADFLSSHIERRNKQNEQWAWWPTLSFSCEDTVPEENQIKSFNPVYRISNHALHFLDEYMQRDGNQGHFETSMPTALYNNGFRIEDFGGKGEFVMQGYYNRFYIQANGINNGTMRWCPVYQPDDVDPLQSPNKLFHPVK